MKIYKEENEFKVSRIMDKYYGYQSDADDNPKPSPPILLELLVDKEEKDDQEEYSLKMKKSSEDKSPAIISNSYRSITRYEEPMGKQISQKFPPKKRLLSEYYKEGEAAVHDNKKKIKNEEFSCCAAKPTPELQRKFIYIKNKAWGSSFMHYFVKENEFVEAQKPKKKKSNKRISDYDSPANQQPPPLPQKYREKVDAMGVSEPVLVIQKRLFKSDLTQQHNRFSIPFKQKRADFLTDEEKEFVKKNQLEVTLIDPCLVEWKLNMKEWNMNTSVYVLTTNWYKLVLENADLEEGTEVQLWSFRLGTTLCFVLVTLDC
ncbi:hypothetical protein LguiB_001640 [Lonicera macranthoides]